MMILELHSRGGKTPTEIAKELSLPRSTVQYTIDHELDFRSRGGETAHQHRARMLETLNIVTVGDLNMPSKADSRQKQQPKPDKSPKDPDDPHTWDRDERHIRRMARMGRLVSDKTDGN